MKTVGLEDFSTLPRPEVYWIIPEFLPKPSFILLVAPPKAGKSFMALQLGIAAAQGGTFLNRTVAKERVLYLQFDAGEMGERERFKNLAASGISLSGPIFMLHPETKPNRINILHPDHYKYLSEAVSECNPGIVVVDVLREIHSGDEQDATWMKLVGDALMELTKGRVCFTLHHPRKPQHGMTTTNPVDAARGSSALTGKVDAVWWITGGYLLIESRFGPDQKIKVSQGTNGLWTFHGI